MFMIREYQEKFKMYQLQDQSAGSWVTIAPERGGIITGFGIGEQNFLYLDEDTFNDPATNVRGGVPILFPICGQLENDQYLCNGVHYRLKSHGFGRTLPWEVTGTDNNGRSALKIRLASNEQTKTMYPFDFELYFTYALKGNQIRIEQEYRNNSEVMMPFYAGFHPYFKVGDKSKISYDTDGSIYYDYEDNKIKPFNKNFDFTNVSTAKLLLDQSKKEIAFYDPTLNRKVHLKYSKEFKYPLLWSLPGKDFICLEPFMAKMNALNSQEDLKWINPHGVLKASLIITGELF